jgi:hypothetical protein
LGGITHSFVDPIWDRAFEGHIKPLSAKAFANSLHGGRGSLQHPGYLPVYERPSFEVLSEVGLQEDAGAIEHPCRSLARPDQFQQTLALLPPQLDHVLLLHGGSPRHRFVTGYRKSPLTKD